MFEIFCILNRKKSSELSTKRFYTENSVYKMYILLYYNIAKLSQYLISSKDEYIHK